MLIPSFTVLSPLVNDEIMEQIKLGVQEGFFCTKVREPIPKFRNAQCEKVITQFESNGDPNNNCFIVLGRDRPSNLASGCGGAGYTSSGMIDLVVGRVALNSAEEMKKKDGKPVGQEETVDPNFITDAARVYITQKCLNIDEYFGFSNTTVPSGVLRLKSAVAVKADHVRMISRETMRFYCGGAQNVDGLSDKGEPNTLGGELYKGKIEFVCGPGKEDLLQPAVLGNNLVSYLGLVEEEISNLRRDMGTVMEHLLALNAQIAVLTLGGGGLYTRHAVQNIEKWVNQLYGSINSELRRLNALNSLRIIKGSNSITSDYVFVT